MTIKAKHIPDDAKTSRTEKAPKRSIEASQKGPRTPLVHASSIGMGQEGIQSREPCGRADVAPKLIWQSSAKQHMAMLHRAVQTQLEQLYSQAQRESRVAFGTEQYETQRMAQRTDNSDSTNEGDADDDYENPLQTSRPL